MHNIAQNLLNMIKNNLKRVGLIAAIPLFLSSCVIASRHYTTGNPVGNKEGFVKTKIISLEQDLGIGAAAKQGNITKIATVDIKVFMSGRMSVRVTGE